jgi:hypothetical protein
MESMHLLIFYICFFPGHHSGKRKKSGTSTPPTVLPAYLQPKGSALAQKGENVTPKVNLVGHESDNEVNERKYCFLFS